MAGWLNWWSISCPTMMVIIKETYNAWKQYKTRG
ncbi:hypothetical protein SAMN05428953_111116 [Mesorhizobium muleiense]|uniref:Uncharacterized protein n=1 Tax=Mesorhizobium muleiense TaxID=1004279 RepID=A0A1G8YYB2_9HYPH|nr:hypothetical protein SAMN05428953_111116 [Mesorhizobium muleiense]